MSNVSKNLTGEAPVQLGSYNLPTTGNVPEMLSGNDFPPVPAAAIKSDQHP